MLKLSEATEATFRAIARSELESELLLLAYQIGWLEATDALRDDNERALSLVGVRKTHDSEH